MVYGETVIKPDSITLQSSHYVRKGVVCDMEVSRNSDNVDKSFDVTALILIYFSFDSIKYFPSIIILLCPWFYGKLLTWAIKSSLMQLSIIVLNVISDRIFNINSDYITGHEWHIYVQIHSDSV